MTALRLYICRGTMEAAEAAAQCLRNAGHYVAGLAVSKDVDIERMVASGADVFLLDAYMPQPDGNKLAEAIAPNRVVLLKGDIEAAVQEIECIANEKPSPILVRTVKDILIYMGFRLHTRGTQQMIDALTLVCQDDRRLHKLMESVYARVAQKYGCTTQSVERNLRYAVESVWTKGNLPLLQECFGYTVEAERGKPTNKAFLAQMAEHIRLRKA